MRFLFTAFLLIVIFCLAQSGDIPYLNSAFDKLKGAATSICNDARQWVEENKTADAKSAQITYKDHRNVYSPENMVPGHYVDLGERGIVYNPTDSERRAWIKAQHAITHAKQGVKDCEYCRGL